MRLRKPSIRPGPNRCVQLWTASQSITRPFRQPYLRSRNETFNRESPGASYRLCVDEFAPSASPRIGGASANGIRSQRPEEEARLSTKRFPHAVALAAALALTAAATNVRADETTESKAEPTVQELNDRLEGMNEQLQTLLGDVDKLKRFKLSGYLQARWETAENKNDSVKVVGTPLVLTPANNERFYIRRGRLKLTYDASPTSQAVIYFDGNTASGTTRNITLLEAYVTLMDPWTPDHRHQLTIGQMNVPFGYEIERSSSVRELPERSRSENVLFAGERDRGIKLVDAWSPKLETVIGVFNGGGINHADFPNTDPTRAKDFVGRARASLGIIDLAGSYYDGKNLIPLTGPDVQTDKTRFGADAQWFYEMPVLGGGSLRGELYRGEDVNADSVKALVVSVATTTPRDASKDARLLRAGADPGHLATDFVGWYVMWVQNLGEKLQAAARYEQYDPNTDLDHDQFERVGLGLNYFYGGNARITVAYDIPTTDLALGGGRFTDPKDNLWTVQFQHKF
jgi:hypothetical protein